jgi:hypothetical protein
VREIDKLKAKDILTLQSLWRHTGLDKFDVEKFERTVKEIRISSSRIIELLPERLVLLLTTQALESAGALDSISYATTDVPVSVLPKKRKPGKRVMPQRRWFIHHVADWTILSLILIVVLLSVRAAGLFARFSSPIGLSEKIVLAARDLKSGTVLHPNGDLLIARAPAEEKIVKAS